MELAAGASVDRDELDAYLRQRLSPYKVPAEVRAMAQLPAAPTGKLLKHEIKRLAERAPDVQQRLI
ncbi:acyl-CoA synthetase [compost metagenome]